MINLLPKPSQLDTRNGIFHVKSNSNVYCEEATSFVADNLLLRIRERFTAFSGNTIIKEHFDASCDYSTLEGFIMLSCPDLEDEEYSIDINENQVIIKAANYAGFYYAYTTLIQLFPNEIVTNELSFQNLYIHDLPRYKWRGFMLDEARHFFGKDEVLRLIELLSNLKINKFHWHLTDDQGFRIKLDCYPSLTTLGSKRNDSQVGGFYSKRFAGAGHQGYYTKDDIREIIAFAQARAVDVIPEIDLPSHTTAMLASLPELNCDDEKFPVSTTFGNINNIICASKPIAQKILDNIIDEVTDLFPSQYLHLGGNDACAAKWLACDNCSGFIKNNNLASERELLGCFFNRIALRVREKGKSVIVYNSSLTPNLFKDIIIQYSSLEQLSATIDEFASGRKIIVSPSNTYFFDYPYAMTSLKKVYQTPVIPTEFASANDKSDILGVEGMLWTEWIYDREKLDFNVFPRITALAEKSWDENFSTAAFDDFSTRVKAFEDSAIGGDINYAKDCHEPACVLRRIRDRWQWLHNDQYTEVRRNRNK